MTIRFAAAKRADSPVLARLLCASVPLRAANDNAWNLSQDDIMRAALRLFAEHGLGAARMASGNAHDAFFAGDRAQYRRWLAICRLLDRRMAEAVAARARR
jgi:hypothetical protein